MVQADQRLQDGRAVSLLDQRLPCQLVEAADNQEMVRLHAELSVKIRMPRRLDSSQASRAALSYE